MKFNEEIKIQEEVDELRRALKAAQAAEYKAKRKNEEIVEAVYKAARDASLATGRGRSTGAKITPPKQKKTKQQTSEVVLAHATDWQLGKKTVTYGMATCAARMDQLIEKTLHLTDIQRADHPVDDMTLMFGGDMVEGITIFPGQAWEVEAHLFDQLFEASRIMETMVRTFSENYDKVNVVCEFGNHGRLGRKGELPARDNIDAMAYRITQDRTRDLKNVTWQMSNDWYQIVTIGNYKALLVHGDENKSFGGNTPAFGILRKANAWATGVVEDFNDVYMGHWHTPMALTMANGGRVFVTGSPESHNEYAREFIAAIGRPSQRVHFVDPTKGRVTAEYVIWLD